MAPVLRAADVHSGYSGVPVLRGFDILVAAGEIVALLGPNGSGKTTALLTLVGHVRLSRGSIEINGEDATGLPTHRVAQMGVGMVTDTRSLLPSLTVAETFSLLRRRVVEPFDLFPELAKLAKCRCGLLSGGEQQMVAVSRALAPAPRLLLIDELSEGLAPMMVSRLLTAIRGAADEHGVGVLLVEQHVKAALQVADRACVLNRGSVVVDASAASLLADRNRLEATYLGGIDEQTGGPDGTRRHAATSQLTVTENGI
jgi:branched-chain amino acid transport system ATP-binding protein